VPVHVPETHDRELDDREILSGKPRLAATFGPLRWDDDRDVDAGCAKRPFPSSVGWIATAVVDA
jgi:hypothetical protein